MLAALAVLLLITFAFSVGPAVAAPADVWIDAPEGTTEVWVDVEDTTLSAEQLTGSLGLSEADEVSLRFVNSPAGLTAVVESTSPKVALELSSAVAADARVSLTFAAYDGTILAETSSIVSLPVDTTEEVKPPAPVPPTEGSGGGGTAAGSAGGSSGLAATGANVAGVLALAVALIGTGAFYLHQQRKAMSK